MNYGDVQGMHIMKKYKAEDIAANIWIDWTDFFVNRSPVSGKTESEVCDHD